MNLNQSVLVSAAGRPMFGVGGDSAFSTHDYKGYVVSLEWDEVDGEPIMLMWSAGCGRESGVFGICLSSAGKYAQPNGQPTDEGLSECIRALPLLGRMQLPMELNNLMDVVMRFMPDLLRMPPAPRVLRLRAKGKPVLDVTQQDRHGYTVSEASI